MARNTNRGIRAESVAGDPLPIALRVFSTLKKTKPTHRRRTVVHRPTSMFVFDCETTTDEAQRLTFGSYRFIVEGRTLEEGLFHSNEVTTKERRTLRRYVADRTGPLLPILRLLTLDEFRDRLFDSIDGARSLVVGYNVPFDVARIADLSTDGRGQFAGGFSFQLWSFLDEQGRRQKDQYRPRFRVKHIDSKRALMGLGGRKEPDEEDLIPDDSPDGTPEKGYRFPGYILDCKTLAFALTNEAYSLKRACEVFGVEHGKLDVTHHGAITPEYIDYNRRDVQATGELAEKLLAELDKHPVELHPTRAYSPASLGKAYLKALGIPPILERQRFSKRYLGFAQTAFYGGRTSAHIRRTPVPVVHTDFLSMYPTVNALMELRRILTARRIEVERHCAKQVRHFLTRVSADRLFRPETWPHMAAFVLVEPDGDLLPCRAVYSEVSKEWQVGINHVHAGNHSTRPELWYALPDVAASVLRTGKIPKILDAFRIVGRGRLKKLQRVKFRGRVWVDPRKDDFFRTVVELRQQLKSETDEEGKRTRDGLKVLANSTAYGINAEFIREDRQRETAVLCQGLDPVAFEDSVEHPERPGLYCFPPLAALITAGARLMLSLLEHEVAALGGTYAMEDTDSMAIVATETGELVACEGGPHRLRNNAPAVKALRWQDVRHLAARFERLNPYDRNVIPGSILKIEDVNFLNGQQRQVYCYAISAKRYALFELDAQKEPRLLREGTRGKWSEHGLGHLRNPSDPEGEDRDWIGQVWNSIIRRAFGLSGSAPSFAALPAVGRVSITSPAVLRAFRNWNEGRPYAEQVKPFNFLITCHVSRFGHPPGTDAKQFHLIAPYNPNPSAWSGLEWMDQYTTTGETYRVVSGEGLSSSRGIVHIQNYADVLDAYAFHPEAKCADATGATSGKQTVGLHFARHVVIERVRFIGKEANEMEDVEAGLVHAADEVINEYVDPRRDFWQTVVRPAAQKASINELRRVTRLPRQTIVDFRKGRRKVRLKTKRLILDGLFALNILHKSIDSGNR